MSKRSEDQGAAGSAEPEHQIASARGELDACVLGDGLATPYRIDVYGPDALSVATRAGGWLYDHAARGWRVTAALADATDVRPLEILGLRVADLASASAGPDSAPVHVLGVAGDDQNLDASAQLSVLRCIDPGLRMTLWAGNRPRDLGHLRHTARHLLTPAARAFKKQALLAVSNSCVKLLDIETFWFIVNEASPHPS